MIVNLTLYLIRVSPLLAPQDVPIVTAPSCDPLINELTCQEVKLLISPQQSAAWFFLMIEPARNSGVTPRIINQPVGKASYFLGEL
jgi:hypothetical protein